MKISFTDKANATNLNATARQVCQNDNINLECDTLNGFPEQDKHFFLQRRPTDTKGESSTEDNKRKKYCCWK